VSKRGYACSAGLRLTPPDLSRTVDGVSGWVKAV
jgi:hypothetical protein